MEKVLVIIPVMNLWDQYTIHCMDSLAASVHSVPFDILIIDQGSTDQTVEKAHDFGGRKMPGRVFVIENGKNIGCGGGWNQGLEWGLERGYTHFAILNNDILVSPHTIQEMFWRITREPRVLLTSAVDVIKEIPAPQIVLDSGHAVNKKPDTEAPHPNFSCFMISKETVERIGMFDEGFFPAYFEDNDYHYRLKLAGGVDCAIANTRAVFIHYGSRTQNQSLGTPVVPGDLFGKNQAYFVRKWGGVPGQEKFTRPFNDQDKEITYAERRTN